MHIWIVVRLETWSGWDIVFDIVLHRCGRGVISGIMGMTTINQTGWPLPGTLSDKYAFNSRNPLKYSKVGIHHTPFSICFLPIHYLVSTYMQGFYHINIWDRTSTWALSYHEKFLIRYYFFESLIDIDSNLHSFHKILGK